MKNPMTPAIQRLKKWNQKNTKECDKRNSHISNKLHMICISSDNVRQPVTKTFTTLHPTTLNSTSLHLSTLHFLPFKLHPTSLYVSALHFHLNFTQLHYYTCRHFTSSHLNFTQLHFTNLSFGLTPSKFRTAPFHLGGPR